MARLVTGSWRWPRVWISPVRARERSLTPPLHAVIAGHDPLDSTSIDAPVPDVVGAARSGDVVGMKIGVVTELGGEGYAPGVEQRFR